MPLDLGTIEQLYTDIAAAGLALGLIVVPEFKVQYRKSSGALAAKTADMVWVNTPDGQADVTNGEFEVVAIFEIEGFYVPISTISYHSEVYGHIEQWPPSDPICHVLLYRFALHRLGNGHHAETVKRCIGDRKMRAAELGSVVQVCDGAERLWLERARESATRHLESQAISP
jgi:hypothetical protein